jgi:hypothetical protein
VHLYLFRLVKITMNLRKIWGCESKKSLMHFFQVVCYLDKFIIFSLCFFLNSTAFKVQRRYCRPYKVEILEVIMPNFSDFEKIIIVGLKGD